MDTEARWRQPESSLNELLAELHARAVALWPERIVAYLRQLRSAEADRATLPVRIDELCEGVRAVLRARSTPLAAGPSMPDVVTVRSHCVLRAAEIIKQRYQQPLTTSTLAAELGRDRSYLATLFRRETGQTLHRYITDVRLQDAAERILQGEKIEAVALQVGYRSKKSFYRQFRARTGLTPTAFRRLHASALSPS